MLMNDATRNWLFGRPRAAESASFAVITNGVEVLGEVERLTSEEVVLILPAAYALGATCLLRLSPRKGLSALVHALVVAASLIIATKVPRAAWAYRLEFIDHPDSVDNRASETELRLCYSAKAS